MSLSSHKASDHFITKAFQKTSKIPLIVTPRSHRFFVLIWHSPGSRPGNLDQGTQRPSIPVILVPNGVPHLCYKECHHPYITGPEFNCTQGHGIQSLLDSCKLVFCRLPMVYEFRSKPCVICLFPQHHTLDLLWYMSDATQSMSERAKCHEVNMAHLVHESVFLTSKIKNKLFGK